MTEEERLESIREELRKEFLQNPRPRPEVPEYFQGLIADAVDMKDVKLLKVRFHREKAFDTLVTTAVFYADVLPLWLLDTSVTEDKTVRVETLYVAYNDDNRMAGPRNLMPPDEALPWLAAYEFKRADTCGHSLYDWIKACMQAMEDATRPDNA